MLHYLLSWSNYHKTNKYENVKEGAKFFGYTTSHGMWKFPEKVQTKSKQWLVSDDAACLHETQYETKQNLVIFLSLPHIQEHQGCYCMSVCPSTWLSRLINARARVLQQHRSRSIKKHVLLLKNKSIWSRSLQMRLDQHGTSLRILALFSSCHLQRVLGVTRPSCLVLGCVGVGVCAGR